MIIINLLLGVLLIGAFFSILFWTFKNGISPSPTSPKQKKAIMDLIQSEIPKNLKKDILELGSGFLTLAIPVAKLFPDTKVIAYETSLVPYLISKIYIYFFKLPNINLIRKDFFRSDLKNAGLIICYLYPKAMDNLKIKFENELVKGTFIVSNTFAVPDLKPIKTFIVNDLYQTKIYLYKI